MNARTLFRAGFGPLTILMYLGRFGALLLPAGLLFIAALRTLPEVNFNLWLGTAFQFLVCLLTFLTRQNVRQPMGPAVVTLYVIALGWLWLGTPFGDDWFVSLSKSLLLVVPLLCFSLQVLAESGATALRRARLLADRLAARREWPADLVACRTLPEVKALREAVQFDATPALALLSDPRPQVQVAALAALEFRKNWKPGQADIVLQAAQRAGEPTVRATAVAALANVDDRGIIEALAEFLRDRSWEVRRAATEALLWDSDRRWSWIRHAVRRTLDDPLCIEDGPLRHEGQLLTPEAVADLTAWVAQKGLLGQRAALTLGVHYARALSECPSEDLVATMRRQLAKPQTPAPLRIELARLLRNGHALDRSLLEGLLESANPAPLRLLAVEALLAEGEKHSAAVTALRDLARLPNREIALEAADVVQRRLGVDLGLALGEPPPPNHSRQAAEVTRRLMQWAVVADGKGRRSGLRERASV
ncbi:MAG TPA: HEAT repeat domain-containing protein [Gemmataceae bacterium]|nr:HEAT repeat domain-containing protein [Gemmataceae bacterium]